MIKYSEIAKMSEKDLMSKVTALKTELFNAKFARHTSGVSASLNVRTIRKDIARMLTALNAPKTK
jgi:ribosomal protein L29